MIRPRSLQQRMAVFMLFPVAVLLIGMGTAGFLYARKTLLGQWGEAAMLRLQRTAHNVDMRLSRPKEWIRVFQATSGSGCTPDTRDLILREIERLDGVARVFLLPPADTPSASPRGRRHQAHPMHGSRMRDLPLQEVTPPRYDDLVENETVSLMADIPDPSGASLGRLEVVLRFDYLVEGLADRDWWSGHAVFLVDDEGKILTAVGTGRNGRLGDTGNPLEAETLAALQDGRTGTLFAEGFPPEEVSGFYGLMEAPWTLVVMAPGEMILDPIVRFSRYYLFGAFLFAALILLLLRTVTGRTAAAIRTVSHAAEGVARGTLREPLPVTTEDEVGELTRSFNTMMGQLEERIRLRESLDLAQEVQQNLLPGTDLTFEGLDIAALCRYSDQTGGDYYDFLPCPLSDPPRLGIAVGDVVGHGISAALLMTTGRAFLRSRFSQPALLCRVVSDVNRLLCEDTRVTGNFMTLFLLCLEPRERGIQWVRAGHDPALAFDPETDRFFDLTGTGMALGVDPDAHYELRTDLDWGPGMILLVGTDGIWETENPAGERYGKDRLREAIREARNGSAADILRAVTASLDRFRDGIPPHDDITLVVVRG